LKQFFSGNIGYNQKENFPSDESERRPSLFQNDELSIETLTTPLLTTLTVSNALQ
jgi:hypothetical protein